MRRRIRRRKIRRLLTREDLAARGIHFGKTHLRKMWQRGEFPAPIRLTERKLAWVEAEVERWIADKIAAAQ
jgi:prophage regulatory protein